MDRFPSIPKRPLLPASPVRNTLPVTYTEVPLQQGAFEQRSEPPAPSPLEYWRILGRRKGTLAMIGVVGAVVGFLITVPQTPVYQVRTSLEIVGLNGNFLNAKESSPINDGGNSSDGVDIQTQVKILQSDSLLQRVSDKLKGSAAAVAASAPSGRMPSWRKLLNLPEPESKDAGDAALRYAKQSLKVRSVGQTRIVELTVDSQSPQLATQFANTLTSEFIEQNLESRWQTTQHTGEWLTSQLDDMRQRLLNSEDRLQAAARNAGMVFADDKTSVSEDKLRQLQQALSAAQTDRIAKESRAQMAESSPPEALPDVLNDPTLRDYQSKITELDRQLAELDTKFTGQYPKIQRLQAQRAALQTALDRERTDILRRIRNEFEEAQRREKLLVAEYTQQREVVTGEGERAVQYNILKQEVDSNRQLYDAMLQQLKQSTLASALRASNIRVVDPAILPKRPYKPDVPVNASLGLLGGLFLGAAFIVTWERADRSIQDPGETPLFLYAPELGIVPADHKGARAKLHLGGQRRRLPQAEPSSNTAEGLATLSRYVDAPVWQNKGSMFEEAFRATLVSILFSADESSRPRVLVVTSSSPSEGKSTVVSNLGIAIAEVNQKVLLIDADLRKPRLDYLFGLDNAKGLSDLLRCKDPTVSVHDFIQDSGVPGLKIMTSGSSTSAATSLLYSQRVPEILKSLRSEFETILIDTPPMLQIPDARVLGRMADSVILVVRAGKTTRDAALAARLRFSEDGTTMLGTILNDWNPKNSANGYYGYYGKYSSYYKAYHNG